MSITTTDHDHGHDDHDHGPAVEGAENPGGAHESAFARDQKERLALWLFIGGDALFLILELFTWFYLRALNTNGMWNGAQCSKANPCTDGLGNPIVAQITKANPAYSITVAVLAVLAAAFVWMTETSARKGAGRRAVSGSAGLAFVFLLAAVAAQIFQFQKLPFTTVDGAYASTYEFFMGSTLAHLILLLFVVFGLWIRAGRGRYEGATWYRVRLIRYFTVWIALSVVILAVVGSLFY